MANEVTSNAGEQKADSYAWLAYVYLALFFLVMVGLGASIKWDVFKNKFRKPKGILIGAFSQFILMPALGFMVAYLTVEQIGQPMAVGMVVVCSCPGGANSNIMTWLVDADFILSVAMTATSSLLAVGFMPLNAFLYTRPLVTEGIELNLSGIVLSALTVLIGTGVGIFINEKRPSWHKVTEPVATICGLGLIIFGMVQNAMSDGPVWAQPGVVYMVVWVPLLVGLACGIGLALLFKLPKPSAVAVGFETSVQNTLIAVAVINITFDSATAGKAVALPIIYTVFSLLSSLVMVVVFWKLGWTNADPSAGFCQVVCQVYHRYKESKKPDPTNASAEGRYSHPEPLQSAQSVKETGEEETQEVQRTPLMIHAKETGEEETQEVHLAICAKEKRSLASSRTIQSSTSTE